MTAIPEMLTIKEVSARTGLSYDSIRKKCLRGEIVHIRNGQKFLVNFGKFCEYLNGNVQHVEGQPDEV